MHFKHFLAFIYQKEIYFFVNRLGFGVVGSFGRKNLPSIPFLLQATPQGAQSDLAFNLQALSIFFFSKKRGIGLCDFQ